MDIKIQDAEKLTNIFGSWPSFHDAEVLELTFTRGNIKERSNAEFQGPLLTARILLWELTDEVAENGYYIQKHHTITKLLFEDISELILDGFGSQNPINGLLISKSEKQPGQIEVDFDPTFDIDLRFTCSTIRVLETIPCNRLGEPLA